MSGDDERVAGAVDHKDTAAGSIEPKEGSLAPVKDASLASETEVRGSNQN